MFCVRGHIALNSVLPESMLTGKAGINFTDCVHQCIYAAVCSVYPRWKMWSVIYQKDAYNDYYLAAVFEDACLESLSDVVGDIYGDDDEGPAVDFAEHYDLIMSHRKYLATQGQVPAPAYPSMFNDHLAGRRKKRMWRDHSRFYEGANM